MTEKIYALKNADFVKITAAGETFYGGNQNWFGDEFSRNGGCGVTAAANILAYTALNHEEYRALYPAETLDKDSFTEFMGTLCGYVRIRSFFGKPIGVWGKSRLQRGVEKYARDCGVGLRAVSAGAAYTLENAAGYIAAALEKDMPAAMLIGFNGAMKDIRYEYPNGRSYRHAFERHWVTVTEMKVTGERVKVKVSSWGAEAELDLGDFVNGENVYSALIYFE